MTTQLKLFDEGLSPAIQMLREGADLLLSVSGGKDSDAMSHYLIDMHRREGWTGDVRMVHANLGENRVEWHQTPQYVKDLAKRKGVPLHVVQWPHGDLIDRIWQRYEKDSTRPPWPSSAIRYCTSDLKRAPISKFIRNHYPSDRIVISAMGLRAEESSARAKRETFRERKDSTSATKNRFVYDWLPIQDWTTEQVWDEINRHGGDCHPAYKLDTPNERLSCALCVLASYGDLMNGATHNPDIYRAYCEIEAVTGFSFRQNLWISDLRPDLLSQETLDAIANHKEAKA